MSEKYYKQIDFKIKSFLNKYYTYRLSEKFGKSNLLTLRQIFILSSRMVQCSEMFFDGKNEKEEVVFQGNGPIFTDDASEYFISCLRFNRINDQQHLSLFSRYEQIMDDSVGKATSYIIELLEQEDE